MSQEIITEPRVWSTRADTRLQGDALSFMLSSETSPSFLLVLLLGWHPHCVNTRRILHAAHEAPAPRPAPPLKFYY